MSLISVGWMTPIVKPIKITGHNLAETYEFCRMEHFCAMWIFLLPNVRGVFYLLLDLDLSNEQIRLMSLVSSAAAFWKWLIRNQINASTLSPSMMLKYQWNVLPILISTRPVLECGCWSIFSYYLPKDSWINLEKNSCGFDQLRPYKCFYWAHLHT